MELLQPSQHSNIFMSKQEVRLELLTLLDWFEGKKYLIVSRSDILAVVK